MTKEKIIETIENKGNIEIDPNGNTRCEIQGEDIFYIANEILALMEQEKKELLALFEQEGGEIALAIVQDVKRKLGLNLDLHIVDGFNQRIEQEKQEVAIEILNDLKGLLEGYVHTEGNISLYEYYCKKYGVEL